MGDAEKAERRKVQAQLTIRLSNQSTHNNLSELHNNNNNNNNTNNNLSELHLSWKMET